MGAGLGRHRLHEADAEGRAQDQEPGQHLGQGEVEPGAVGAEHRRRRLDHDPSPVTGAERLPRRPSRRTPPAPAGRPASDGTSHSVIGAVGGQRPARPDVAVGLAGGGDPALAGVEADRPSPLGGGAQRRPEVAARPDLGERQRGEVAGPPPMALRIVVGPWFSITTVAGVVHQHDHGRRAAEPPPAARITSAAARHARPPPPTSPAEHSPEIPASPRASTAWRGNAPSVSTRTALGATTSSTMRFRSSR